jgi:hypothetical protein
MMSKHLSINFSRKVHGEDFLKDVSKYRDQFFDPEDNLLESRITPNWEKFVFFLNGHDRWRAFRASRDTWFSRYSRTVFGLSDAGKKQAEDVITIRKFMRDVGVNVHYLQARCRIKSVNDKITSGQPWEKGDLDKLWSVLEAVTDQPLKAKKEPTPSEIVKCGLPVLEVDIRETDLGVLYKLLAGRYERLGERSSKGVRSEIDSLQRVLVLVESHLEKGK